MDMVELIEECVTIRLLLNAAGLVFGEFIASTDDKIRQRRFEQWISMRHSIHYIQCRPPQAMKKPVASASSVAVARAQNKAS